MKPTPEYRREYMRQWRAKHPGYDKRTYKDNEARYGFRWRRYGLTTEITEDMWFAQGCACLGCGKPAARPDSLVVDHDHACCPGSRSCGKCVRGLLCGSCNTRDVLNVA